MKPIRQLLPFLLALLLAGCAPGVPMAAQTALPAPTSFQTAEGPDTDEAGTPEADDALTPGSVYRVTAGQSLSLRISPSVKAKKVALLPSQSRVRALDADREFTRVETCDGKRGYVLTEYLALTREAFAGTPLAGLCTVICRDHVSLREEADADGAVHDQLKPGTSVELLSYGEHYSRVKAGDAEGYVLTAYLSAGQTLEEDKEDTPLQAQEEALWTADCEEYLTLRDAPDQDASSLTRVRPGEEVSVKGYSGLYAQASYNGQDGWLLSGYLSQNRPLYQRQLALTQVSEKYSYEQMARDLAALEARYEGVTLTAIGKSARGRELYVLIVGDPNAKKQVLVQASMHAREHMTATLAVGLAEYILAHRDTVFGQGTVGDAIADTCFHILPMTNPDGVSLAQNAVMTDELRVIYENDRSRGVTLAEAGYLARWKANANGVDLNRNFPAGWENEASRAKPSSDRYRGASPGDQPETQALMAYVLGHRFSASVSLHAYGSILYWQYGNDDATNAQSRDLARAIQSVTRYPLVGKTNDVPAGGFKDWVTQALGIPSVTVEVGTRACPLPLTEFDSVWMRCRNLLPAVAAWLE